MLVRTMYNDETGLTLDPVSQYRCVLPDHPQDQEFAGPIRPGNTVDAFSKIVVCLLRCSFTRLCKERA